mmetsp:Transcript_4643/g.7007  ORF Transcript_4643/g.7007 Transcript_4643/m.7007 type:complete len:323 (-) Transcript_4643:4355-5323(-)
MAYSIDDTQNFRLSIIERECEEISSGHYRFVDGDNYFVETIVTPGCAITVQSSADVSFWKLQRIWSGSGTIPESRIKSTVIPHNNERTATVQLWTPGLYELSTQINNGRSFTIALRLRVVYIRREIRSLDKDQRTNYLNALVILGTTNTKEGQRLYGRDYSSLIDLIIRHFNGATAGRLNDHFHEGLGFLSQHIALTNEFEKSMQSVDPRVSVPYWDFTKDSIIEPNSASDEIPTLVAANPILWSEPDVFFAITSQFGARAITPIDKLKTSALYKANSFASTMEFESRYKISALFSSIRHRARLTNELALMFDARKFYQRKE